VELLLKYLDDKVLPYDPNGLYILISAQDVTANDGYCDYYCAYHGYFISETYGFLKVAFVPNVANCPNGGIFPLKRTISPNGILE